MSCSARCLDAAPMKSCGVGPKCSRGITRSPENWITRSIDAVWLVSVMAFYFFGCGSLVLMRVLIFHRGSQGVRVSTHCTVACSPVSLPSTRQTQLGRAVLGSNLFVLIFFVRFLGICGESACVSHLPVGRSSHPWRGVQPL